MQSRKAGRPHKSQIVAKSSFSEGDTSIEELNQLLAENMEKINGMYMCKICQKTSKDKTNLGKHVESHLEGLCFSCNECPQQYRSRDALRKHKCNRRILQ